MDDAKMETEVRVLRLQKGDVVHVAVTADPEILTKEYIQGVESIYQKKLDNRLGKGFVKVMAVGLTKDDSVELTILRQEGESKPTIVERIENATTQALMDLQAPKTIFLGKKEWAQYCRETAQDRIVLAGNVAGKTSYSAWLKNASVVAVVPTEVESEFRLHTESLPEAAADLK